MVRHLITQFDETTPPHPAEFPALCWGSQCGGGLGSPTPLWSTVSVSSWDTSVSHIDLCAVLIVLATMGTAWEGTMLCCYQCLFVCFSRHAVTGMLGVSYLVSVIPLYSYQFMYLRVSSNYPFYLLVLLVSGSWHTTVDFSSCLSNLPCCVCKLWT